MIEDIEAYVADQMVADMGRKCRVLKRWRDPDRGDMARVEVAGNGDAGQPLPPPPVAEDAPRKRGRPRKNQE